MSNLIENVTPQTRGIIWFTKDLSSSGVNYKSIDYLVNGLLTSLLKETTEKDHQIIITESFGMPLYVLVATDVIDSQVKSFFTLISKDLSLESDIMLISDQAQRDAFYKLAPSEHSKLVKL